MDLTAYGSPQPFRWTHADLIKYLGGITNRNPIVSDPLALNSFRLLDRADFVPEAGDQDIYSDKPVEIGFKQWSASPSTLAKKLSYLNPQPGNKYLHIGSGTGYFTALLAQIVGSSGETFGMERIQWLWEQSRSARQKYQGLSGLQLLYRDGQEGLPSQAPFDGIVVSLIFDSEPEALLKQLKDGGKLIVPNRQNQLVIYEKVDDEFEFTKEIVPGFTSLEFGEIGTGLV